MKLVQLNMWGGRLDKVVSNFLQQQDPDFACLQEAISTKGDAALAISVESLQELTPLAHTFHSPVFSFRLMNKNAHFGNAVMSKLEPVAEKTVFTNLEYKDDFDFDSDDYNIRNFQHVSFKIDGKSLHLLNHHGHHVKQHKNGDGETLRQTKQIADYVARLDGAVILTGDFNLAPESESIAQINAVLRNLSSEFNLKTTRTQLTHKTEVCDYIFVNDSVNVAEFYASDEIVSDHKALVLDFSL